MKLILRTIVITIVLIVGLTAIHKTKDVELLPEVTHAESYNLIPEITHVEPPTIVEEPQPIVEPQPVETTHQEPVETPQVVVTSTGDCSLAYNYDWNADIAYQICMKESGGNPLASNWQDNHSSWAGCMGSFGLMQVACGFAPFFGIAVTDLHHGPTNMEIAYKVYLRSGSFSPWSTCARVAGCY